MATSTQSSSKRPKLGSNHDQNDIDRLSNLPEHLLLHILSFLPTETAISTSVLSKSWQFLWSLVPNLDFDNSRSHPKDAPILRRFANFVTRVLHRRERFIRRFRLKCDSYQSPSELDSWVSCAIIYKNIQELDLDLGYGTYNLKFWSYCTQQSFKNLAVLKLRTVVVVIDEFSFPVLKIFHLEVAREAKFDVQYREIKFLPSRFPVLEELLISHKFQCEKTNFEICLHKLRSLAIDKWTKKGFVRIDCRALTHLVIKDESSREFHLENLLNLAEADINVRPRQDKKKKHKNYGLYVMNVVKAVSNVRILRLSLHTMKEIERSRALSSYSFFHLHEIPVFYNLVQVELPFVGCAWEIIILMLQKFENLKCLTLCYQGAEWKVGGRRKCRARVDMKELIKQTQVPNCLTSHLTAFCFRKFEGTNDEMEVTRYILKNALVLQSMTIFSSSSLDNLRIRREICESPTTSEGCRFEFLRELKKM